MTTRAQRAKAVPTPAKQKICICGCGKTTTMHHGFAPGHDARYMWAEARLMGFNSVMEVVEGLRIARWFQISAEKRATGEGPKEV